VKSLCAIQGRRSVIFYALGEDDEIYRTTSDGEPWEMVEIRKTMEEEEKHQEALRKAEQEVDDIRTKMWEDDEKQEAKQSWIKRALKRF